MKKVVYFLVSDLKARFLDYLLWEIILASINNNLKSCLIIRLLNLFNSSYLFWELCIDLLPKISRSTFYTIRLKLVFLDKKISWRLSVAEVACLTKIFSTSLELLTWIYLEVNNIKINC